MQLTLFRDLSLTSISGSERRPPCRVGQTASRAQPIFTTKAATTFLPVIGNAPAQQDRPRHYSRGVLNRPLLLSFRGYNTVGDTGIVHLLPGLVAPAHGTRRVRIGLVGRRVVIPRSRRELGSLGRYQWFCKLVAGLSVEVIGRDQQHRSPPPALSLHTSASSCHKPCLSLYPYSQNASGRRQPPRAHPQSHKQCELEVAGGS